MQTNTIIQGDALEVLKTLPNESINCSMSSPPYWALRDYGIDGQLGLEKTFDEYINKLCDIYDEVKRVLRKDGTCWVNLGDTYYGSGKGAGGDISKSKQVWTFEEKTKKICDNCGKGFDGYAFQQFCGSACSGVDNTPRRKKGMLQDKCLTMIPQRFAIEMINRGWILRNTIIWHKPNCMPSSVKDRFTVDFEYIFFFVKSKKYWFDLPRDPHLTNENRPSGIVRNRIYNYDSKFNNNPEAYNSPRARTQREDYDAQEHFYHPQGRAKRTVWKINPKPFPEAHFAVYPEELCETPIQAGCPEFVCKKCGKAREKITEYKSEIDKWDEDYWYKFLLGNSHSNRYYKTALKIMKEWMDKSKNYNYSDFYEYWKEEMSGRWGEGGTLQEGQSNKLKSHLPFPKPETRMTSGIKGYTNCNCNSGFESGIVLDPFIGSGTTGLVALKQNKRFIGIELNKEYIEIANRRLLPYLEQRKLIQ